MQIIIGTRGSKLALWQADYIAAQLKHLGHLPEIRIIETTGDKILNVSLSKIGSKGVFTKELEDQLMDGRIDIAVHSAKDLPSSLPNGLELLAFSEREITNDVVVSFQRNLRLDTPTPLILGTSSTRRVAMLKHYYKQHRIVDMRGNLQTRMRKLEEGVCDALILAYAGVHRMGYSAFVNTTLSIDQFTPQAGQGAIALEASQNLDPSKKDAIRLACNHEATEKAVRAERAFLEAMNGGCSIPTFVHATWLDNNQIHIQCGIISLDGTQLVSKQTTVAASAAAHAAVDLAKAVLHDGGAAILAQIRQQQGS